MMAQVKYAVNAVQSQAGISSQIVLGTYVTQALSFALLRDHPASILSVCEKGLYLDS